MDSQTVRRGPIEGTSRVMRELLRTPRFKAGVRIVLRDLDPENAALLVRTIMFEDPEFFLSLLAATPAFANALTAFLEEAVEQASLLPAGVVTGFMTGIVRDVDARGLGRTAGKALALCARLAAEPDEELRGATTAFWDGVGGGIAESLAGGAGAGEGAAGLLLDAFMPLLGSAVSRLGARAAREGSEARRLVRGVSRSVRAIADENPEFMTQIVVPLVAAGREVLARAEADSTGKGGKEES